LKKILSKQRTEYLKIATDIHDKRAKAARRFEKEVEANLKAVALEKARFEVRIDAPNARIYKARNNRNLTAKGYDQIEFYFSANVGESPNRWRKSPPAVKRRA
jgi:DNA repair ATPase RecN